MPKTYQKLAENVLDMLEKTSLCCIRSVLYVLYVLKPAKRADFSMIGRFVNFLMTISPHGIMTMHAWRGVRRQAYRSALTP